MAKSVVPYALVMVPGLESNPASDLNVVAVPQTPVRQEVGIARLIAITGIGAGETRGHDGWFYNRIVYPLFIRNRYVDKDRQGAIIERSGLDWTIVRPAPVHVEGWRRILARLHGYSAGSAIAVDHPQRGRHLHPRHAGKRQLHSREAVHRPFLTHKTACGRDDGCSGVEGIMSVRFRPYYPYRRRVLSRDRRFLWNK